MIRIQVAIAATITLVLASHAVAQRPEIPSRLPDGGAAFLVKITVPWSTLELGDDRNETFEGKLKCWKPEGGEQYFVWTDLQLRDGNGRTLDAAEDLTFERNKEGDAAGDQEFLPGSLIPREQRYRLVAKSDLALVPVRMLYPHDMPTSRGGAPASRTINHEHFHVQFDEKFGGVDMVSITPLRKYACRTVRTFRPSGFQLIDYTLTYEDERDDSVMCGFGLRLLVHPSRPLPNGDEAPAGVFHFSFIELYQMDWRRERSVIPMEEWTQRFPRWYDSLADDLFSAIGMEAIGNPYNSPSAFALRVMHVLDEISLHRLASRADPRLLAPLVPQLLDLPLAFDPARFAAAREDTVDPVERLLLAAAMAVAGQVDDLAVKETEIALNSKHPNTLRAAFDFARASRRPELARPVAAAIANCTREEDVMHAVRALAAIGGSGARVGIEDVLLDPGSERLRAAALAALADLGDPADEPLLIGADARFGAVNPDTGVFEVLIEDSNRAGDALEKVAELGQAIREGDVDHILAQLSRALAGEKSDSPEESGVAHAARECLVRLGPIVLDLADKLTDHQYQDVARRVVRAAGRSQIDRILLALNQAQGKQKIPYGRLAGTTRDPRVEQPLDRLRDSEDFDEIEAGDAGWEALFKDER